MKELHKLYPKVVTRLLFLKLPNKLFTVNKLLMPLTSCCFHDLALKCNIF